MQKTLIPRALKKVQNINDEVLVNRIVSLFLHRFFIGYWILKTGLDFYPGPLFFYITSLHFLIDSPLVFNIQSRFLLTKTWL
jgi:hypothetical protein